MRGVRPVAHRATSTAPMVQLPTLATPCWSVRGQTWTPFRVVLVGMAPIAVLPVAADTGDSGDALVEDAVAWLPGSL